MYQHKKISKDIKWKNKATEDTQNTINSIQFSNIQSTYCLVIQLYGVKL